MNLQNDNSATEDTGHLAFLISLCDLCGQLLLMV